MQSTVTTMMAMSCLPEGYEDGRFHLLALGIYVRLEYMKILVFCGLNKHGGTPPIAPSGHSEVAHDATRMMGVMYPPEAMINGAGSMKTILATLGKGHLELPPEVTGYAFVFSVLFSKSNSYLFVDLSSSRNPPTKRIGPPMVKVSWRMFHCFDMYPGVCCRFLHMS